MNTLYDKLQHSALARLGLSTAAWVEDEVTGAWVLHVLNPHALLQAIGYIKYLSGEASVFFRGQQELFPSLIPALYRGVTRQAGKSERDRYLSEYLDGVDTCGVLEKVPKSSREALLQHYGIRTRWLDVVDSIWVALWFACHESLVAGPQGRYLHFEKRCQRATDASKNFAYIVLLSIGAREPGPESSSPGIILGSETEVIDLRQAVPSQFLRPHSQHALVFRRRKNLDHSRTDYSEFAVGAIRVNLEDALEWLGDGPLLTTHGLFPPPVHDQGYGALLKYAPTGRDEVGGICHVGA